MRQMAEKHNVKEIEAGLKHLLKLEGSGGAGTGVKDMLTDAKGPLQPQPSRVVISREDLMSKEQKPCPLQSKKKKKGSAKNREHDPGGVTSPAVNNKSKAAVDPAGPASSTAAHKKKHKKKKNSIPQDGNIREKVSETNAVKVTNRMDSDEDSEDEAVPAKAVSDAPLAVKYLDDKLTLRVLKELEAENIFPLKKKSVKFPTAQYFCRLCSYHCDTVPVCRQHFADPRHRRKKEIMVQETKLRSLSHPSERQLVALDTLVDDIYLKHGLSDEDMAVRQSVVVEIEKYLEKYIPDISLKLYGSSLNGLGLKFSDVNMDMVLGNGESLPKTLVKVYKTLLASERYSDVKTDFQSKVPSVLFKSHDGSLDCQITIGCEVSYYTSRYLAMYTKLDPRVRMLAVIFRYWAKVCQVDRQEHGSLPAYTYGLMTVYFLQQCKPPILPVFWKVLSEETLRRPKTANDVLSALAEFEKEIWASCNEHSVGALWRNMLMFYGVEFDLAEYIICIRNKQLLSRAEKKWKSKRVCIEDPFSPKRNVARSLANTRIFDYFFNCLRKGCLYFSQPSNQRSLQANKHKQRHKKTHSSATQAGQSKVLDVEEAEIPASTGSDETSKSVAAVNQHPVPTEMEPTYNSNGDIYSSDSISIRQHEFLESCISAGSVEETMCHECGKDKSPALITEGNIETGQKQQSSEKIHSEDDKTVVLENCDKVRIIEDILLDLLDKSSGVSDSINHDTNSNASNSTDAVLQRALESGSKNLCETKPVCECTEAQTSCDVISDVDDDVTEMETPETATASINCDSITVDSDVDLDSGSDSSGSHSLKETPDSSPLSKRKKRVSSPVDAEYMYELSTQTLTDGKGPSIFCEICEKEGHLKATCPEDQLPKLVELPPITKQHLTLLTLVIKQVPKDFKLSRRELDQRDAIVHDLEKHLQTIFPDAQLCLFGSSKNGFGFHHSDLDICVTFRGRDQKDINFVEYIEVICKRLKEHRGLFAVFPITSAKVPIVKFRHRESGLDGDISLFNILAQENTRLLSMYSHIDHRVTTLGFAIKVFAKVCDIGDASRGSLSSYAYMLMMLHYLQHTKPPVIPVLQELGEPDPDLMIDGWNVWFFDDFQRLPEVWPGYGKNTQSVGALWLGFFRYYLEEFCFEEQVVSIRQYAPLTKFEKLWNGKCTAIEDPFDRNHNLGGALSRKMNQYIWRTFVHARELYGKCIDRIPDGFQTIQDYFFDKEQLTEGEPPSDRLCRACNKIGHIAKECPVIAARKDREKERKRREERQRQAEAQAEQNASVAMNRKTPNKQEPGFNRRNSRPTSAQSSSDHSSSSGSRYQRPQVYLRQQSYPVDQRQSQMMKGQAQGRQSSPLLPSPEQQKFPPGFFYFPQPTQHSSAFQGAPRQNLSPSSPKPLMFSGGPQQDPGIRFSQPNQYAYPKKNGAPRFSSNQGGR